MTAGIGAGPTPEGMRPWIVAIAVISLFASVAALVFGDQLAARDPEETNSLSDGPLGHRALVDTLTAMGLVVARELHPRWSETPDPMIFIEPTLTTVSVDGDEYSLREVLEARRELRAVSVVVLPKWSMIQGQVVPSPNIERVLGAIPGSFFLAQRGAESEWTSIAAHGLGGEYALELRAPQLLMPRAEAVIEAEAGTLLAMDETGTLLVLSDPDVLHNFNLQRADHAALVESIIRDYLESDTILIDEVFHGLGESRSLPRLFSSWPGYLALFQLFLIVLVVLLMGRKRFGPPAPAPLAHGRGPAEIIGVAASVLAIGSRPGTLAARYLDAVVSDVHRRLSLAEHPSLAQKAERIDAYAKTRGLPQRARSLIEQARGLEGQASASAALAAARDAASFRAMMLRPAQLSSNQASLTQVASTSPGSRSEDFNSSNQGPPNQGPPNQGPPNQGPPNQGPPSQERA